MHGCGGTGPGRSTPGSGRHDPTCDALRHPGWTDELGRLAAAEAAAFDPAERFDLWVGGAGLADPAAVTALRDRADETVRPTDAAVVPVVSVGADGADGTAVRYGLEREQFRPTEGLSLADGGAEGARVDAVYAMPYAGRAAFRPPERAAALLTEQPDEIATFGIASRELG